MAKIKRSKLDVLKTKLAVKGQSMTALDRFDLELDIKEEESRLLAEKELKAKKSQKLATKKYLSKKKKSVKKKRILETDDEYEKFRKEHNAKIDAIEKAKAKNIVSDENSWNRFFRLVQDPISKKWIDPEKIKEKNRKKRPYFKKN